MAVPRTTQVQPGVRVNIVLKADQRTGKLTTGQVADILTRGDHPRGIKVRLADGQIGRVQSISLSSSSVGSTGNSDVAPSSSHAAPPAQISQARSGARPWAGSGSAGSRGLQDDYRRDPVPADTSSLLDYIKPAKQKKKKKGGPAVADSSSQAASFDTNSTNNDNADIPLQQQLEAEFPTLDSALVAAIVADHGSDIALARATLVSLSEG